MKQDIQTRADVESLIDKFYIKVKKDPVIGYFFTEVVNLSWDVHIPIMYSFWESVLLGGSGYRGNPMKTHLELNKLSPLTAVHFDQWLKLWKETIHELFEGPKAEEAITKASSIKDLMLFKINQSKLPGFIQ